MSGDLSKSTILGLVEALVPEFPEMEKRIVAVSEIEVDRTRIPKMPIAMFALQDINFAHNVQGNRPPETSEVIVGEFWFPSNKLKLSSGAESPFWAYYDYDVLLLRFVSFLLNWKSPKGFQLQVMKMDLESSDLAVMISFTLRHTYTFCPIQEEPYGIIGDTIKVAQRLCVPKACVDQTLEG